MINFSSTKVIRVFIIIIILFNCNTGLCQNTLRTPRQLLKLFKLSINQLSRKGVDIGSGAWTICNQDSSFFKSDTLRVYDNLNYFYQISQVVAVQSWAISRQVYFRKMALNICSCWVRAYQQ